MLRPKRLIAAGYRISYMGFFAHRLYLLPSKWSFIPKRGAVQMKNLTDVFGVWQTIPSSSHENPWAIRNPLDEARDLYRMVRSGSSAIDEIRELIAVPDPIREALLAYAERYPKDGQHIHCVLQFRERVADEFERLITNDVNVAEFPEESMEETADSEVLVN